MSIVRLPDGHPALPFTTIEGVEIGCAEDANRLFNTWEFTDKKAGERVFEYARLNEIGSFIVSADFQDVLRRKYYCEKFSVPPFAGDFDAQPKWWLMALNVIEKAEAEAINFMRRRNG